MNPKNPRMPFNTTAKGLIGYLSDKCLENQRKYETKEITESEYKLTKEKIMCRIAFIASAAKFVLDK